MGLCLNASKAETRLDMATLLLGLISVRGRIGVSLHPRVRSRTWFRTKFSNMHCRSLIWSEDDIFARTFTYYFHLPIFRFIFTTFLSNFIHLFSLPTHNFEIHWKVARFWEPAGFTTCIRRGRCGSRTSSHWAGCSKGSSRPPAPAA